MPNTRRPTATALLAALAVALLSLGLGAAPAHAAAYTVTIKQYQFGSGALTVQQGDTVTWVNQDEAPHDVVVTSGPATFRSPMLQKGQRWSYTLSAPGTYSYVCSVHPDMHGTLTVKAKPVPAPQPAQAAPTHSMAAMPTTAPTTPAGTPTTAAPQKAGTAHGTVAAAPSATTAPAPTTAGVTPESASGLNPLLLVAGVAVAVVVFCLLLLASRPAGKQN